MLNRLARVFLALLVLFSATTFAPPAQALPSYSTMKEFWHCDYTPLGWRFQSCGGKPFRSRRFFRILDAGDGDRMRRIRNARAVVPVPIRLVHGDFGAVRATVVLMIPVAGEMGHPFASLRKIHSQVPSPLCEGRRCRRRRRGATNPRPPA